jgi:hypothetical protein
MFYLCKNISGFDHAGFVSKNGTYAISCPNIFRVVSQYLFVHGQSTVLMSLFSVLVSGGLVQGLQPDVAESYQGISIVLGGWVSEDSLKLLLSRSPFHLGQMEISQQRPSIGVFIVDSERFLRQHLN